MIATSTVQLYNAIGGDFVVSFGLGITIASVIMIIWLIFKGSKGGAYADFTRDM